MPRKVFFSFEYSDVSRAMVVRNSCVTKDKTGFIDKAESEKLERQGDDAIKRWINNQIYGTSVTVVLIGEKTCTSRWVRYEIEKSIERGNGILGIDISQIDDLQGKTTSSCNYRTILSNHYDFYLWFNDNGYENIEKWIEKAARD